MPPVKRRRKAKRSKQTVTEVNDDDTIDWICNIPQPIIHQILSRLLPIDVIKTCLLSKTLQSALYSFPVIDLDISWFSADFKSSEFEKYLRNRIQRLKDTPLRQFAIRNRVIELDTKHGIKEAFQFTIRKDSDEELDLDLARPRISIPLTFIKYATSLVTLHLAGLKLYDLNGFDMSSSWPVLENLCFSSFTGLKKFEFSSMRIRSIVLGLDDGILYSVKIKSQSLQKFEYAKPHHWSNFFVICHIDTSECPFMKILSFGCVCLVDYWVEDNVPKLAHLEELHLIDMRYHAMRVISSESLKKLVWAGSNDPIEIKSPNRESLIVHVAFIESVSFKPRMELRQLSLEAYEIKRDCLEQHLSYMDGLESLELNFNHNCTLKRFEIRRSPGSSSDADKVVELKLNLKILASYKCDHSLLHNYIINSKGQLLDVTLFIDSGSPLDKHYLVALWNWIACFGRVKVLTLCYSSPQELVCSKHLRKDSLSPFYDLKYLTVRLPTWRNIRPNLVDRFLWQSPNLETLCFVSNEGDQRSFEFEYGTRNGTKDEPICC